MELTILIAVVTQFIAQMFMLGRIWQRLGELDRRLGSVEQSIRDLNVRVALLEQRLMDWILQVREWRKDEDERLGNHKNRLEHLEKGLS